MHGIELPSTKVNAAAGIASAANAPTATRARDDRWRVLVQVIGDQECRGNGWVNIAHAYVIAPRLILKVPRVRPFRALVGVSLALVLAGCVPTGLPETVLAPQMRYLCRDGSSLLVERSPDGRFAIATTGVQRARLMRTDSAAQEKYTAGGTTLYLDGDNALLTSDSFVVAGPCVASQPMPVVQPWQPR